MKTKERSTVKKREDVHAVLQSSNVGSAIRKFSELSGAAKLSKSEFVIPVPVRTVNSPASDQEVKISFPILKRDSLVFIRECGFEVKEGTFAGSSQGQITIPKEGLSALSFVLENSPELESQGREFFKRSLSFFGKPSVDYDQLITGLDPGQIAAGTILLKVATEGLPGLNGDLFLSAKFKQALERQKKGLSEQVLSKTLDMQANTLLHLTELIQ